MLASAAWAAATMLATWLVGAVTVDAIAAVAAAARADAVAAGAGAENGGEVEVDVSASDAKAAAACIPVVAGWGKPALGPAGGVTEARGTAEEGGMAWITA